MTGSSVAVIRPPVDGPCGVAFTTRIGGISTGPYADWNLGANVGDLPENVRGNRLRLCAELGIDAGLVAAGTQVHGTQIRSVAPSDANGRFLIPDHPWPDGDGLMSAAPGQALTVFGADCLPVVMWRRDRPLVAAVHAGWRGLVAGVLEAAVGQLGAPERVGVAIGPGIGPCCYPVSDEVRTRFAARFGGGVVLGQAVDLGAAAMVALAAAGVSERAVWRMEACTSCDANRWFSFRRDGAPTGRQAGIIWPVASGA